MNFRAIFVAAAMILTPMMSHAVTVPVPSTDPTSPNELSAGVYRYDVDFFDGAAGQTLDFIFINDTASSAVLSIASGTIAQLTAFFTGGVELEWIGSGQSDSVAGVSGGDSSIGPVLSSILGSEATDTLRLTFGDVEEAVSGGLANIDFQVFATPVPVPAGILLMGTALAGFGVARRRKPKKSV